MRTNALAIVLAVIGTLGTISVFDREARFQALHAVAQISGYTLLESVFILAALYALALVSLLVGISILFSRAFSRSKRISGGNQ